VSRDAFTPGSLRVACLAQDRGRQIGLDEPGADSVNPNVFVSVIDRHALGEQNHCPFRWRVGGPVTCPVDAENRSDVDGEWLFRIDANTLAQDAVLGHYVSKDLRTEVAPYLKQ